MLKDIAKEIQKTYESIEKYVPIVVERGEV
jgi:hypothetical protein